MKWRRQHCGTTDSDAAYKQQHPTLAPVHGPAAPFPIQLPANAQKGSKRWPNATSMEEAPGLGLAQPQCCSHYGSEPADGDSFCPFFHNVALKEMLRNTTGYTTSNLERMGPTRKTTVSSAGVNCVL